MNFLHYLHLALPYLEGAVAATAVWFVAVYTTRKSSPITVVTENTAARLLGDEVERLKKADGEKTKAINNLQAETKSLSSKIPTIPAAINANDLALDHRVSNLAGEIEFLKNKRLPEIDRAILTLENKVNRSNVIGKF